MLVASGRTKAPAGGPNAKHSADLEPACHGDPLTRNTGNLDYAARAHATRRGSHPPRCPRPFWPRARLIFWGSSDSEMAMVTAESPAREAAAQTGPRPLPPAPSLVLCIVRHELLRPDSAAAELPAIDRRRSLSRAACAVMSARRCKKKQGQSGIPYGSTCQYRFFDSTYTYT